MMLLIFCSIFKIKFFQKIQKKAFIKGKKSLQIKHFLRFILHSYYVVQYTRTKFISAFFFIRKLSGFLKISFFHNTSFSLSNIRAFFSPSVKHFVSDCDSEISVFSKEDSKESEERKVEK